MTEQPRPGDSDETRGPTGSRAASTSLGAGTFWPEDYVPGRADKICLALVMFSAVYGFAVMLARPRLLGYNPLVLAALSGSRSALVTIGARFATGLTSEAVVVAAFVLATLSLIKLDLLFWWAGRLWGDFFLKALVGDSRRKARQAQRAESLARRYAVLAIILSNVPVLPIPKTIVFAVLGISGASFRKIFVVDLLCAAVVQALWLYLGYTIGEPVVQVVEVIARYSLWITLAILAVAIGGAMLKARRTATGAGGAGTDAGGRRL